MVGGGGGGGFLQMRGPIEGQLSLTCISGTPSPVVVN